MWAREETGARMERTIKLTAVVVGGLVLLCVSSSIARAQGAPQPHPVMHVASLAPGSILGVVSDERGAPVPGAIVSALGSTTAVGVTDRSGRFELRTLTPGPYLLRAHLTGYVASRGQVVEVRSSSRSSSAIALRRTNASALTSASPALPILAAGLGAASEPAAQPNDGAVASPQPDGSTTPDNHGEVA
jgi:Carboxypeptidase regulatory-like domain